ncbi:hypothetical protein [Sulfurimonas sp. CS5]|uniref:hypothetical protein n=1 Tax=Sulfurimonas sp. CS5 TaxID=3391145 RepID=UPI0039EBFD17
MTNVRNDIFPQMREYDQMESGKIVPFAMLSGPISYKSENIHTDRHGFRVSKFKNNYISMDDISKFDDINIIIGGSTVFGVGSTSNDTTISSILSQKTNEPWFNLGIRGGVSFTEYIHLIRFIYKAKNVKQIVFFSGINDIYINMLTEYKNDFDNRFENNKVEYGCKRKLISTVLSKLYFIKQSDIEDLSLKDMILYPFIKKEEVKEKKLTDNEQVEILFENFRRNFLLYSALSKQFDTKVTYILQPFSDWTDKEFTNDELEVFEYLEKLQKGSKWASHKSKLSKELYYRVSTFMSEELNNLNIKFIDSHNEFNTKETIFVDAVHINDIGNQIASEIIFNSIKDE